MTEQWKAEGQWGVEYRRQEIYFMVDEETAREVAGNPEMRLVRFVNGEWENVND